MGDARNSNPDLVGLVRLCIELVERRDAGHSRWSVVASLPGREGTLRYSWQADGPHLDSRQLKDLEAKMYQLILEAILFGSAVQEVIPGIR